MARIRSIKPEFWSSEQVMDCSPMARLLFIGLWNFCDDGGNHAASAKTIKAEIFPGDDITSPDVQGLLDELSANKLIVRYTATDKEFYHVTGWQHQKIEKPTYKHPPFFEGKSTPPRRLVSEPSTPEGSGEEGKGVESNGVEGSGEEVQQLTPAQVSKTMRDNSIEAAPHEPKIIALAAQGVSLKTIALACKEARKAKPNERISSGYVIAILERWAKDAAKVNAAGARPPQQQGNATSKQEQLDADNAAAFELLYGKQATEVIDG